MRCNGPRSRKAVQRRPRQAHHAPIRRPRRRNRHSTQVAVLWTSPPPPDSAISSLYRYTSAMPPCRTPAEIIALSLLARDGIAAIWGLHLSAALAYRDGRKAVAAGGIEIAGAAEREWLRAEAAVTESPG